MSGKKNLWHHIYIWMVPLTKQLPRPLHLIYCFGGKIFSINKQTKTYISVNFIKSTTDYWKLLTAGSDVVLAVFHFYCIEPPSKRVDSAQTANIFTTKNTTFPCVPIVLPLHCTFVLNFWSAMILPHWKYFHCQKYNFSLASISNIPTP